jgi:NTP pyrophosphatase (non-canonical NTP hydrolase)
MSMSEGHVLATAQITKHGKDRYPTVAQQFGKVLAELGELGEALITGMDANDQRDEFADVGLALYELGNKLGFDLIAAMHELVARDTRSFA